MMQVFYMHNYFFLKNMIVNSKSFYIFCPNVFAYSCSNKGYGVQCIVVAKILPISLGYTVVEKYT